MKLILLIFLLASPIAISPVYGQNINFKEGFRKANPVTPDTNLSLEESIKTHQDYRDQAIRTKDLQKQVYGYLFLVTDYLKLQDYTQATQCILDAEVIARAANNPGWLGIIAHLKGVVAVRMKDYAAAIAPYEQAAALCGQAGDSLCLGESLEQIATMHLRLDDFEKAERYFGLAIPLLEKYGDAVSVATSLNNLGLFYFDQDRYSEAIPYFKQAYTKYHENEDQKHEAQVLNNLAATYLELKRFDEALAIYDQCLHLNTALNQYDNLITNYSGLANLYEDKGDFEKSLEYFIIYYDLRDSLIGAKTEKEIAELEIKYESQKKELDLQKSKSELTTTQQTVERQAGFIVFGLLLAGFGLWRWRMLSRNAKQVLLQNQAALGDLTRVLMEKNRMLLEMDAQTLKEQDPQLNQTSITDDFDENLYNQRILTHEDWEGFKGYFEKAYPGYLRRLRSSFPALSEAEKRLFLFIKLNLTTREAATILGISAESVKKTRNRLRHRLELGEETDLEVFIQAF